MNRFRVLGLLGLSLFVLISVCAASDAISASAQTQASAVDAGLFKDMRWRGIGPYRGGRALAVEGISGEPGTFYFGAAAGGVWKTIDSGATWTPIFDAAPISSIGAIAVAPSNHDVI